MSFISYSQNLEDVMLFRALKHVQEGFYIDVGANDPFFHSVTKLFYDRGWTGINIEPVPSWFQKLSQVRTRDINLQVAASDQAGELNLHEVVNTGLSTLSSEIAQRHVRDHGFSVREFTVPALTLTEICKKSVKSEIHFLKIDVEGAEEIVLRGLDLKQFRPWIILLESTQPMTQQEEYSKWEPLLTEHGYHFVYFDGLNRFYIADEHKELDQAFRYPPVTFWDDFKTTEQAEWDHKLQQLSDEVQKKSEDLKKNEQLLLESENLRLESEYLRHQMLNSFSWKVTAPFRNDWSYVQSAFVKVSKRFSISRVKSFPVKIFRKLLSRIIHFVKGRPVLAQGLFWLLNKVPILRKIYQKYFKVGSNAAPWTTEKLKNELGLNQRESNLFLQLKKTIEEKDKPDADRS